MIKLFIWWQDKINPRLSQVKGKFFYFIAYLFLNFWSPSNSIPPGINNSQQANQQPQVANALPEGLGNMDLVQEIMRTFNETNILRRNRRLIFQQSARHYLEQVRFNQTESFDVLQRSMNDIQGLMQSKLSFAQAQLPENIHPIHLNRRFRE